MLDAEATTAVHMDFGISEVVPCSWPCLRPLLGPYMTIPAAEPLSTCCVVMGLIVLSRQSRTWPY